MNKTILASLASFLAGAAIVGSFALGRATADVKSPPTAHMPVESPKAAEVPAVASFPIISPTAIYKTSFDCSKASFYAEHLMCEDRGLAASDRAYWKKFQAARRASTDRQAFHVHAITVFKERQACQDRECIVNWFAAQNKYLDSLSAADVAQDGQ